MKFKCHIYVGLEQKEKVFKVNIKDDSVALSQGSTRGQGLE